MNNCFTPLAIHNDNYLTETHKSKFWEGHTELEHSQKSSLGNFTFSDFRQITDIFKHAFGI